MKIHFIGVGGIGVSALAQYYLQKGHEISGSDLVSSEITEFLKNKGVKIFIGNKPENLDKSVDLVVFSPAVPPNNPEIKKARELKISLQSYPEALGELTKKYFTIAVSGSHGKSTTTAIIGLVLIKAGLDPTVVVGTRLKEFGDSNFRPGEGKFLVIEACEYDGSFLNYEPKIIIVTNVDKEHLDYFKTFKNVIKTFKNFVLKLPENGFLVSNKDDKNLVKISNGKFTTKYYSLKSKEAKDLKKILKIPGEHNVSNALAVLETVRILNVRDEISFNAISEYKGSWRRFEIKQGNANGKKIIIVSDYGHHPNEVSATLKAAREKYKNEKIWCIFQPHQYQRTHYLFKDFVKVFRKAPVDNIIITDIYDVAGREEKKISSSVNSENLVKKIAHKNMMHMPQEQAEKFVKENIKNGEVLVIMGAGDVYKLVDKF